MTQPDEILQSQAGDAGEPGEQLILNAPDESKSPKEFLLWSAVILIATLTAYSPALNGKFLWDDDRHVENNRDLRDANGLANIWTGHLRYLLASPQERPRVRFYTPQYYPLTHTTYWFEYQLSAATPDDINTTVFHATNIILHAAGAILLWFILRELSVPGAWVAAAIFALHPVEVESVAWISERKNVLAGVFFFGCILAYLKSGFGFRVSGFGSEEASSPDTQYPKPITRFFNIPPTPPHPATACLPKTPGSRRRRSRCG